ncbi:MAG: DNA damage-inducible protein D [Candidatus Paceibacterota bacterium]|jgi:DNA-damage-inducible protein D
MTKNNKRRKKIFKREFILEKLDKLGVITFEKALTIAWQVYSFGTKMSLPYAQSYKALKNLKQTENAFLEDFKTRKSFSSFVSKMEKDGLILREGRDKLRITHRGRIFTKKKLKIPPWSKTYKIKNMDNEKALLASNENFESIKNIDENGVEYWHARKLMPVLGYENWQKAEEVIARAARACVNSGQDVDNHFNRTVKMVEIGSSSVREVRDYKLDRYACYLIAQNGDPSKKEIAVAQTYFAIQTRRQEVFEQLSDAEKRLFIRNEVSDSNKKLFKTARRAGVTKFGLFNDAGYKGLYGMPLSDVEKSKGIKKGELLDRASSTELAANLFRITQTDEKIIKERVYGEREAAQTHFMVGGKVRQTIKDIGGILPEQLPVEKNIKQIKTKIRQLKKIEKKRIKGSGEEVK